MMRIRSLMIASVVYAVSIAALNVHAQTAHAQAIDVVYDRSFNRRDVRNIVQAGLEPHQTVRTLTFKKARLPTLNPNTHPLLQFDPIFSKHIRNRPLLLITKGPGSYGAAPLCGRVAVVAIKTIQGISREMLTLSITHEIGHMLGMTHRSGDNVMNPDPIGTGYRNRWKLSLAEESKREYCEGA